MSTRVVITGFSALTSVGEDLDQTWQAIRAGQSGIAKITQWDVSEWEFPLGGEIKNYQPRTMIDDRKLLKLISRQDVLGLNVARQVLQHSQLLQYREQLTDVDSFNDRTGIYVGSPGNKFNQQYDFMPLLSKAKRNLHEFAKHLFETVHPMWLLQILPNNVLAYAGMQYGFKGANQNITNHAVSGLQAIGEAYSAIHTGKIDRALVVAYESPIEPQTQLYYGELGVLSRHQLAPFSVCRDGTILAEGAGALIVESLASAQLRGATIYGEILGYACAGEAQGVFQIAADGNGYVRALQASLRAARITSDDVGMITTHGNGGYQSDAIEATAITELFGVRQVPIAAWKWSIGHALAAAPMLETILTLQAIRQNEIPGIHTLRNIADDCKYLLASCETQTPRSPIGMIMSRSFGSLNASLLINGQVIA